MKNALILIPAYRPEPHILANLVAELKQLDPAGIVLVDDGSGPAYADVFNRLASGHNVTLLKHPSNRGKGAALRTGFTHIAQLKLPCSHVITVDADGQHLPGDVARVADDALRYPGCLVMGARAFKGKVPLRSWIGNKATYLLFRGLVGRAVADTQTGLRAIPVHLLERISGLTANRYAYELQMLLTLIQDGLKIREVAIQTVYEDNNGNSNFRPLRDSFMVYKTLFGWWMANRFMEMIKYGLTGILATITDFAGYALLIHMSYGIVTASVLARVLAVVVHFSSNKYFTFSIHNRPNMGEIVKYLMVALFNLVASILLIFLFVTYLSMGEVLAKLLAQVALFFTSYTLLNGFVFIRARDQV